MTELISRFPVDEPISTSLDRGDLKRRILAVLLEHSIAFNGVCFCGERTNPHRFDSSLDHQAGVLADATGLPQGWTAAVLAAHETAADLTCTCEVTISGMAEYGVAEHLAEALAATMPTASVRLYLNAARQRATIRRREAAGNTTPHVLGCVSG